MAGGAIEKVWRCPGCATLQAEASACFVCFRSATSCGTCANFRGAVVTGVGYCGLDRRREALTGNEQRGCWTATAAGAGDGLFALSESRADAAPPRLSGLVELDVRPAHR